MRSSLLRILVSSSTRPPGFAPLGASVDVSTTGGMIIALEFRADSLASSGLNGGGGGDSSKKFSNQKNVFLSHESFENQLRKHENVSLSPSLAK